MSEATLQLQIPVVLPHIVDERDQCVDRLTELIAARKGIRQAHIKRQDDQALVCLHYDPNLLLVAQVQRLAEQAGAPDCKSLPPRDVPCRRHGLLGLRDGDRA